MTVINHKSVMIDESKIPSGLSRRSFLKRLGGGITIAVTVGGYATLNGCSDANLGDEYNAYLRIKDDGRVDCLVGKIEMGQSVYTSLKQLLAEELDVALESVDIVMGDTDLCPYDAGTWGSLSIRTFGPELRAGAAQGRRVLLEMAAKELGVSTEMLIVENGVVQVKDASKKISYADLVKDRQVVSAISEQPPLKKPGDFK